MTTNLPENDCFVFSDIEDYAISTKRIMDHFKCFLNFKTAVSSENCCISADLQIKRSIIKLHSLAVSMPALKESWV